MVWLFWAGLQWGSSFLFCFCFWIGVYWCFHAFLVFRLGGFFLFAMFNKRFLSLADRLGLLPYQRAGDNVQKRSIFFPAHYLVLSPSSFFYSVGRTICSWRLPAKIMGNSLLSFFSLSSGDRVFFFWIAGTDKSRLLVNSKKTTVSQLSF